MQRTGTSKSISTVAVVIGAAGVDRSKFIDVCGEQGDDGLMSRCLSNFEAGFRSVSLCMVVDGGKVKGGLQFTRAHYLCTACRIY